AVQRSPDGRVDEATRDRLSARGPVRARRRGGRMTADRRPRVRWRGTVAAATLDTVVLVAFVAFVPRYQQRAVQVFVIVVGALVVRLLVRAVVATASRPGSLAFDRALVRPPEREVARVSEPDRIRFEVGSATHRAMELHQQVRRRLRALAADRL